MEDLIRWSHQFGTFFGAKAKFIVTKPAIPSVTGAPLEESGKKYQNINILHTGDILIWHASQTVWSEFTGSFRSNNVIQK